MQEKMQAIPEERPVQFCQQDGATRSKELSQILLVGQQTPCRFSLRFSYLLRGT